MKRILIVLTILCLTFSLVAEWSEDAALNNQISGLTGDQAIPKTAQNPDGSCYIGWWSNATGNYNMRLQHLDPEGNILWEENGILISDNPQMSWLTDWDMTVDLEGNALLAFNDVREGEEQLDIFGYKISSGGEFLWGENGINLSNGGFNAAPKVIACANNNAVYAWHDEALIKVVSISPEGDLLWDTPIIINEPDTSSWPQLLPAYNDGSEGNFLLKYYVDSGPFWAPDRYVYLMKYDQFSNPVWDTPAVVSDATGISAWTQVISFCPDSSGGAILAWHDDRNSESISRAYVQHISSQGTPLFDDGVQVGDHGANNQYYPQAVFQPFDENIYVYWRETDSNQNNAGILGQKIDSAGQLLYNNAGITISPIQSTGGSIIALRPLQEDVAVVYSVYPWGNFSNEQILAERINPEGDLVWDETLLISDMQMPKLHTDTADYFCEAEGFTPQDGFIVSWGCESDGIYAQRFNEDGTIGAAPVQLPAPVNLVATAEGFTIFLSWEMPDDRALSGFELYRNDELVSTFDDPSIRETIDFVSNYGNYTYYLIAVYEEGNSAPSNYDSVYLEEPHNPPSDFTVDAATGLMEWDDPIYIPPPGRMLEGYNVYLDSVLIDYVTELEYQLTDLIADESYIAGVSAVYTNGESQILSLEFVYSPVSKHQALLPKPIINCRNFPNPFNPSTTISFELPHSAFVSLDIYNAKGQFVESLLNQSLREGDYHIQWQPKLPSAVYYYILNADGYTAKRRMLLLK